MGSMILQYQIVLTFIYLDIYSWNTLQHDFRLPWTRRPWIDRDDSCIHWLQDVCVKYAGVLSETYGKQQRDAAVINANSKLHQ